MTRYLISFDDGWMDFPEEELPDVAKAAHAVVEEAKDAGVWVFGGGLENQRASVVATDGTVTDGPYPETKEVIGGFAVVDVPTREQALEWAAKLAAACRCAQEVRELGFDPPSDRRGSDGRPNRSNAAACTSARRCRCRSRSPCRGLARWSRSRGGVSRRIRR
jgi:hypothetical protein